MVEGSTTTGKRGNGIIMRCLFGDSRLQYISRIVLLLIIGLLFLFKYFIGPIIGLVLFVFLCFGSSTKKLNISVVNKCSLKALFFSNRPQREFMHIFTILIWLVIISPLHYGGFIQSCVHGIHQYILLLNKTFGYSLNFVDIDTFHFVFWDIAVIVMSIILAYMYQREIFSTIDQKGNFKNLAKDLRMISNLIHGSVILMMVSIICFLFKFHATALFFLFSTAMTFLYYDIWMIKIIKKSKLEKEEKIKRIKKVEQSLYFANIPATTGLIILFFAVVIINNNDIVLMNNISLTAFVAGGSAMHMVFGNLIVGICLRKDDNA